MTITGVYVALLTGIAAATAYLLFHLERRVVRIEQALIAALNDMREQEAS